MFSASLKKSDALSQIRARALALGFDEIGVTSAELPDRVADGLAGFLAEGHHGTMGWLQDRAAQRSSPRGLWPDARSVISLGFSYAPEGDPLAGLEQKSTGNISVYARGRDYHDVIKGKLKHLAQFIATRFDAEVKVFVDTAPVMEKPLAQQAGLGWQGKHTNLVSRRHGSWLFLAEIYTNLDLPADPPHLDRCGSCHRCLDACPTDAFPSPYRLDARRCISYLTIEHEGPIPEDLRPAMGNRIYGCDDCLAVCPWNRFAEAGREAKLSARPELVSPDLATLLSDDDAAFRARFAGGPIKRIGHARMRRNLLIAAGNSADPSLLQQVEAARGAADPVIAQTADWASARLRAC